MRINLVAPVNDTSYGLVSMNILKSLCDAGHNVSLFPITLREDVPQYFVPYIKNALASAKMPDFNAPCIRIWHQFDMSLFVGNGPKIGFPIFELDGFNDIEKLHLSSLQHCFVCSQWAKDILVSHNILQSEQISVIPLGTDAKIFYPTQSITKTDYIFLNVGKWEVRKGHDILPDIFTSAFCPSDKVQLWMCNHNIHLNESDNNEWRRYYEAKIPAHQLKFIPRVRTQDDLAVVMNSVDCGIFPSRAEGWNLEATEMLSCGKDIVISNSTAHTEYCSDLPYAFDLPNKESAFDGRWFFNQGLWHNIGEQEISRAAELMRLAFTNKGKNHASNLELGKKFSWEETVRAITDALPHVS